MPGPKAGLMLRQSCSSRGNQCWRGGKGGSLRRDQAWPGCPGSPRSVSAGSATSHRGSQIADVHAPGTRHLLNKRAPDFLSLCLRPGEGPPLGRQSLRSWRRAGAPRGALLHLRGGAARELRRGGGAAGSLNFLESRSFMVKLGRRVRHKTRAGWRGGVRVPPTIKKTKGFFKRETLMQLTSTPTMCQALGREPSLVVLILTVTTDPEGGTVPT